ncbi:MAG TPA: bifunctional FO biosynthesis protein CofGH [Mycobacteriales bacterium]|nr:bifunctional FO biosynthesis protein CofGH [Mycobacteriales bacterium]
MTQVPSAAAMRRALRRARDGVTLDEVEATVLLHARGPDLDDLCAAAGRVRDAGHGRVITYSRKVFIPLTRLCRDRCHYCTFATVPGRLPAPYLDPDAVLEIARAGQAQGCKEALFTLGDRPEERWPQAAEWLEAHGYASTVDYLRAMAIRVLEETGLLPHLNPGVLTWAELARLRPVAASMGMMLETTATRLWCEPDGPHFGSPDKEPALRLRVLEDAGRHAIPFTTGILIGIGETAAERVDALFAIRRIARLHAGIQEVIVQNFRAKADTAMRDVGEPTMEDLAATVAVARLVLGPTMHLQAPPNLVGEDFALMLRAGIDDWGGVSPVTPDHVNPERPWPAIAHLDAETAKAGFQLRERLTVYPRHLATPDPWIDPRVLPHVRALAGDDGWARLDTVARGRPWQEPESAWSSAGRTDLHATIDAAGRSADRRSDFDTVYGDWSLVRLSAGAAGSAALPRLTGDVAAALRSAERSPADVTDGEALAMMSADGLDLDAVCSLADAVRRDAVGDDVTYVINRNINFTNVCYVGCRFCAFAQRRTDADAYTLSLAEVGDRSVEAWDAGATEVCVQGGIHPDLPGTAYWDIAAEVKRRTPEMHVHAFSPMEVVNGASRTGLSIEDWLVKARESGLDTIPGTAAEILDDEVRWVLTKGKLPTATWIEVITTAHRLGIRSSSTMMYGHVDHPGHWVAHLRVLSQIQEETGGFTEFVPLPFVHHNAPLYLAGIARPGPTTRDDRAVHAVARLLLHGRIDHVQASWVKLGAEGVRTVLRGGVDDLGGTLMEETISRMAGSEHGSRRSPGELVAMAARAGRPARQRTTSYGSVPAERAAAAARADSFGPDIPVRTGSASYTRGMLGPIG